MKHKSIGPGLIVALGRPSDDAGKMGVRGAGAGDSSALPYGRGSAGRGSVDAANVDTVPVSMLSMPDDQEQMQPPEVGDVVNYQVTGKVVAIEGQYAKVQRQSINGQDMPGADQDQDETDNGQDGGDGQSLRDDAAGIGMLG